MDGCCSEGHKLFALVAYLPEPLAGFVDALREELSPGCRLRAHITILPPRELSCGQEAAATQIQKILTQAHHFRVALGNVKIFNVSEVVHLEVGTGLEQVRELHGLFNRGVCKANELWDFEPHVTLAQELEPPDIPAAFDLAARRWREYSGPRGFTLDRLTFVSRGPSTGDATHDCWEDLATWELPVAVLA
jgi:2'-5' RNA ligase